LKEALAIALAIAEALEAAHDKGVVHRDLKPANVKASPEGIVKVLDLGLATALPGSEREPDDPQNSPTLTMGATQAGVIIGTAAYMSPEQASGKRVDKRADIWSFGVVLWEMLTGKRLFDGETISHTLADVLRADIKFDQVRAPARIIELLKRCLDRNVKTRLRDIGEARIILQGDASKVEAPRSSGSRAAAGYPLGKPFWAASALAVLFAAGALWDWLRPRPADPKPVIRFSFASPGFLNTFGGFPMPSLSRDGSIVAYRSYSDKPIVVRRIDQFEEQQVPGTEGGSSLLLTR
jgi:serine/threonine protein kinase